MSLMLKIDEIKELIELINNSTIDEFSYEQDGSKVKIKKKKNRKGRRLVRKMK